MKQGRPIRAGSGIGGVPRLYGRQLRQAVKRRYLIHRVLNYHGRDGMIPVLASEFKLAEHTVRHLLQQEGVR